MKDGLPQMLLRRKNMSKYCDNCANKGSVNSDCRVCTVAENNGQEISIPSHYVPKNKEMVNHPLHYGGADNPYEAIKVIEAWEANFNIGTTLRYLCRCGKKTIGGSAEEMRLEDLKKARWYLDREIQNIEKSLVKK